MVYLIFNVVNQISANKVHALNNAMITNLYYVKFPV